ncbi:hypothetical protein NMG60_11024199 [Bertholletia excelsa]
MGDQGVSQLSILIFNGENYDFWSLKAKTVFRSQDLWEIAKNGFEEPDPTTTLTEAQKKDLRENNLFPRIMRAKMSKKAWVVLQKEFQGNVKAWIIKLQTVRADLENLKMRETESLKEYFSKIVEKILISLSEKYDTIVSVVEETKDLSTLSVRELMASLQCHEQRLSRHSKKTIKSALQSKLSLATKTRVPSSKGGRLGREKGRGQRGRGRGNFDRSSSVDNSGIRCGICKMSSHVDKDCWFKGKP